MQAVKGVEVGFAAEAPPVSAQSAGRSTTIAKLPFTRGASRAGLENGMTTGRSVVAACQTHLYPAPSLESVDLLTASRRRPLTTARRAWSCRQRDRRSHGGDRSRRPFWKNWRRPDGNSPQFQWIPRTGEKLLALWLSIVKFGDPVLEHEAETVTEFDTPELHKFLDDVRIDVRRQGRRARRPQIISGRSPSSTYQRRAP